MLEQGVLGCKESLYKLLQVCIKAKDLSFCRQLHSSLIFRGLDSSAFFGNHLITLFTTSGKLFEACLTFHKVIDASPSTWHAIIYAHAKLAHPEEAFHVLLHCKEVHDIKPEQPTFLCLLKAFTDYETALISVRLLHNQVIICGLEGDVALGSTFVDVYAKCGSLGEAYKVFIGIPNRNKVSWGAMISVCAQHRQDELALELFEKMQQEGKKPGRVIFLGALKACSHLAVIDEGRLLHDQIIKMGLLSEQSIGNSLIDMYAKCKSLEEAHRIFDTILHRDVVSWSAMLAGYVENGLSSSALDLFAKGQQEGIEADKVMFLSILKACSSTQSIEKGIMVHQKIQASGLEADTIIGNALVDMYAKCGSVENARSVFNKMNIRHIVTWGAMLSGYAQLGHGRYALELFNEMMHCKGVEPNDAVFLAVLKACASVGSVCEGMLVHGQVVERRLESDLVVSNAVIDMYIKCGGLEEASTQFRKLQKRDVVSWSEMIMGYIHCGQYEAAGDHLEEMIVEGVNPDEQIFTTLLTACSHSGLLTEGRRFFNLMRACGLTPSVVHYNCIIDLMSRAGQIHEAESLLQSIPAGVDAIGCMSLLTSCRTYGQEQLGKQNEECHDACSVHLKCVEACS